MGRPSKQRFASGNVLLPLTESDKVLDTYLLGSLKEGKARRNRPQMRTPSKTQISSDPLADSPCLPARRRVPLDDPVLRLNDVLHEPHQARQLAGIFDGSLFLRAQRYPLKQQRLL